MEPMFCQYCGEPLSDGCDCLGELAEYEAQLIEDYENDPMTQYGWHMQDVIEFGHINQR
jgi:hypothetical protein